MELTQLFNAAINILAWREQMTKLGPYEVYDIRRDEAVVAGIPVTRAELEALLTVMDSATTRFEIKDFTRSVSGSQEYLSFRIATDHNGWIWTEKTNWNANEAHFCLRREYAAKLMNFLEAHL